MRGRRLRGLSALAVFAVLFALGGCGEVLEKVDVLSGAKAPDPPPVYSGPADPERIALARSDFDNGRPAQGIAVLRPMAADGDAEAQFLLGLAYRDGRGVAADRAEALRLFEAAAAQGHPDAAYLAGLAWYRGRGVEADPERAVAYMYQAGEAGHAAARYHMGVFHQAGVGVKRDPEIAVQWFRLAARQGFPEAAAALADAFENGVGVEKDLMWSMRWQERAASFGVVRSQYKFGALLAAGRGMPADPETGLRWLLLAARAGDPDAGRIADAVRGMLPPDKRRRAAAAADAWTPQPAGHLSIADAPTLRFIQAALKQLGIDAGPVDGLDGPRTRAAIQRFRQARGLRSGTAIDTAFLSVLKEERRRSS